MIIKITILISALVLLNFLLLKFSCNKIKKQSKVNKQPVVLRPQIILELETESLAPTGS